MKEIVAQLRISIAHLLFVCPLIVWRIILFIFTTATSSSFTFSTITLFDLIFHEIDTEICVNEFIC